MTIDDPRPDDATGVPAAEIEALTKRIAGPVLAPDHEHYNTERTGYQLARQHRPAVVVGATGPADVKAAVDFARVNGLPVAVQGTGHAVAGIAAEGGLLITTSRMTGVRLDAGSRTAWVAAGTKWEPVIHEAAAAGLAPLSGSYPNLGVASYTLAGGLSLLSRRYGYAADRVRSLDVVTADGQLRHVTESADADLFWALRGGRDNFGVVTGIELELVPVTQLYGGSLQFVGDLAGTVFDTYVQWAATVPDEVSSSVAQVSFPDVPALPAELRGKQVVLVRIAYVSDDVDAGDRLVAPLRALGPQSDTLRLLPYTEAGSIYADPPFPGSYETGTVMLGEIDSATVRALLDQTPPVTALPHIVELRHLGGQLARPAEVGNAVGNRDARFVFNMVSRLERADIADIRPAHERVLEALAPWRTGGRLLNFMMGEDAGQQVRSAYDAKDYRRLTEIKAAHDPENIFRLNHNIPPAAENA